MSNVWVDVLESGRADVGEAAVVEVVALVSMGLSGPNPKKTQKATRQSR